MLGHQESASSRFQDELFAMMADKVQSFRSDQSRRLREDVKVIQNCLEEEVGLRRTTVTRRTQEDEDLIGHADCMLKRIDDGVTVARTIEQETSSVRIGLRMRNSTRLMTFAVHVSQSRGRDGQP